MMKTAALVVLALVVPATAFGLGSVTPTALEVTYTKIDLIKTNGSRSTIAEGNFTVTYTKAGEDLVPIPVGTIRVEEGRYVQANICHAPTVYVTIDGETFRGRDGTGVSHGSLVWTAGAGPATAPGSIVTTAPAAGAARLALTYAAPGEPCKLTTFGRPVCISEDGSACHTGDQVINPVTEPPAVNVLIDLYNLMPIEADDLRIHSLPIVPFAVFGRPGAAFHLTYEAPATQGSGTEIGDIGLLFDGSQGLIHAFANPPTAAVPRPPPCGGAVWADNVVGAPGGETSVVVAKADVTGTGVAQFLAAVCPSCGAVYTGGINVVTGFIQPVNNSATVTCVADQDATPPYLGFTYQPTGIGHPGTASYVIKRIIDPANLFGVCPAGSCGTY